MPAGILSLGKDIRVIVQTPEGGRLDIANVTGFTQNWVTKKVNSAPLNAPPIQADLPGGWQCEIDFDRADNVVEDYFVQKEIDFWSGGNYANGTVFIYITEPNGGQSRYQFNGASFSFNGGKWGAEEKVTQKLTFFASTKTRF